MSAAWERAAEAGSDHHMFVVFSGLTGRSVVRAVAAAAALLVGGAALAGCAPEPSERGPSTGSAAPAPSSSSSTTDTGAGAGGATSSSDPTVSPTATASLTPGPASEVSVLVVTADALGDQLQVTAMVPGVSESDGTCTLDAGGGAVDAITGTAGNGVTYCGIMTVSPEGDDAGWSFSVRYESPTSTGASESTTLAGLR